MTPQQILETYGPRIDGVRRTVVGAGPGLSAAIRLKQLAAEKNTEVSVVVLEKGSEPGAHPQRRGDDPRSMVTVPDWKETRARR